MALRDKMALRSDPVANAERLLPLVSSRSYGMEAPGHEVGLLVSLARRSPNSGAPVSKAGGDRQPCRTAVIRHRAARGSGGHLGADAPLRQRVVPL